MGRKSRRSERTNQQHLLADSFGESSGTPLSAIKNRLWKVFSSALSPLVYSFCGCLDFAL